MLRLLSALLVSIAIIAGCSSPPKEQFKAYSNLSPVYLHVYGYPAVAIDLYVTIDDTVVVDSVFRPLAEDEIDLAGYPRSKSDCRLSAGSHSVVTLDRTRKTREQRNFVMKDAATISFYLNADKTEVSIEDGLRMMFY
jgi:hypothetical protein